MRSRRVFRLGWKAPRRDFPQMNVNPKNLKVSGLSFTGTSQVVDQGSSRRLLNPYQNPHWRSHSRLCHENTYKEVISSHTDDSCRC
jgi:hypothetical protein